MTRDRTNLVVDAPGVRLDVFVADSCPHLTRARVKQLITSGHVRVNGEPSPKAGAKLRVGDRVDVEVPPPPRLIAEKLPVSIIYEDEDVLVVDKPPGIPVHPAPGHPDHTLVNALLSHLPHLADDADLRPGIVHRLDKDASGVMVVARNEAAKADLIAQFKSRTVSKAYLVLVKGRLEEDQGAVEAPIGRDPRNRKRMAVVYQGEGKEAATEYRVVEYVGDYTLVEAKPRTGRTHQIRVHLAAIGHPVAGDTVYGSKSQRLPRMFLHACRLGFKLPSSGEYREFTSELPPDLKGVLQAIG